MNTILFWSLALLACWNIFVNHASIAVVGQKTQLISLHHFNAFPGDSPIRTTPSSYHDFVMNSKYFVDNSLLIEYILYNSMTAITLPRRFGKSLNLEMIRTFLEIPYNASTSEPVSKCRTEAHQLFVDGILRNSKGQNVSSLEQPFLIKSKNKSMAEINSVPVIYLNLENPSACSSLDTIHKVNQFLVGKIVQSYAFHQYLSKSLTNGPCFDRYFDAMINVTILGHATELSNPGTFVHFLSQALYDFFQKPVLILIDEYDAVLNTVHFECANFTDDYKKQVLMSFSGFYGTFLKMNRYLRNAVLTGIISWKHAGILSKTGNLVNVHSVTDDDPMDFYGIDQEHVKEMMKRENIPGKDYNGVEKMYNGYLFGDKRAIRKFNPLSIAMYIRTKSLKPYWVESGNVSSALTIMIRYSNFHRSFLTLLLGNELKVASYEGTTALTSFDVRELSTMIRSGQNFKEEDWNRWECRNVRLGLYLLFVTGYLTKHDNNTEEFIRLRIPNDEIKKHLWSSYAELLGIPVNGPNFVLRFESDMKKCSLECWKFLSTNNTDGSDLANSLSSLLSGLSLSKEVSRQYGRGYLNEKFVETLLVAAHFQHFDKISYEEQHYFKAVDGRPYKTGIPDFMVLYNGLITVFELKCANPSASIVKKANDELTEQKSTVKEVFGEEFSDILIPQMLISLNHIKPQIARNSLRNYVNIKPQWKSLEKDWLAIEDHLWEMGQQHWQDVTIYAGTYGTILKNGLEVYFEVDENTKQNIPLVWWKLIIKNKHEGIILAMQNVPKEYPNLEGEKLCKKSICNAHGWGKINEIAYCCPFDETMQKLLNLHEENIVIDKVFDPSPSILSRIGHRLRLS